jgi:hypothetical protein
MNDWEKKERFTYPSGKDSMESRTPEKTPGFLDKYGALILFWIVGIVVVGTCRALGIGRLSP